MFHLAPLPAQGDCSSSDPYADYPGSLRCMMEGGGDVAFTKHDTVLAYAKDGPDAESWSTLAKVLPVPPGAMYRPQLCCLVLGGLATVSTGQRCLGCTRPRQAQPSCCCAAPAPNSVPPRLPTRGLRLTDSSVPTGATPAAGRHAPGVPLRRLCQGGGV